MSLHFDTVSLKNFGPYREVNELRLATKAEAPVVLIHGENTLGKTQLFSAIRWCLYGSFEPQQKPEVATNLLESRFNKIAAREGEDVMEVTMTFTANGESYVLSRQAKCWAGPPRVSADLRIGSAVIQESAIDTEIGRVLHPQISEFFLFDAELMKRFYDRLDTDRERAFIRQSIESVLGIPALQRAEKDVAALADEARDRQAKAAHSVTEADRINRRLRALSADQVRFDLDKSELHNVLRAAENELRDLEDKLKGVESLQADIREQEVLDAQISGGELDEQRLKLEMQQLLSGGWLAAAAGKLSGALESIQERNSLALQHQIEVNEARTQVAVLHERVRGGQCPACKQPLPAPSEGTREELLAAQEKLAAIQRRIGNLPDLDLERKVNSLVDHTTGARYSDKQNQLNELRRLQYLRRRNREQIKDRLLGNSAAEIRSWAQRQEHLEEVAKSTKSQIRGVEKRSADASVEQQRLARQLDRLPGAQPQVVLEANFFGYVQELLGRTIERYQERTRQEVQTSASNMFVNLIHDPQGYGGLRIAPDYQVELLDTRGNKRDTSEGGRQLVALSLIGALKQAAVRGGPVILDSPLARLDLDHRANVLKTWIPSLGSQAVLLVQSGELTQEEAYRILGSTIGHEYRIVRPTNDPELAIIERTQ